MNALEFSPRIFSVGVANPNMRTFDIVMHTDFGTTYNAYCVRGESKMALIETVHACKWDEYLENLSSVCDVSKVDYIVMNHTEPDHSGSLAKLLELAPQATVVATVAALRFLKAICNRDFKSITVKDGMTIDLGGKTLRFIVAPNLHWPDSMFTYVPENKVIFTCDFLGAHYCETRSLLSQMQHISEYEDAFRHYFECIFEPFKKFVLAGLSKMQPFEIEKVAVSHGPILDTGIAHAMELYKKWSTPETGGKFAVIAYVSAYGYTRMLADVARKELESKGFGVKIFDLTKTPAAEAAAAAMSADVFLLGSPTINRDALPNVWDFIAHLDAVNVAGKHAGVFGSYGWTGEAVPALASRLAFLKCKVAGEGFRANFKPSDGELEGMRAYASALADEAKK